MGLSVVVAVGLCGEWAGLGASSPRGLPLLVQSPVAVDYNHVMYLLFFDVDFSNLPLPESELARYAV